MDIQALAPGVRMALSALGFKPEQIVALMTNIGDGIKQVNAQLAEIKDQQREILERISRLENDNGRHSDAEPIFDFNTVRAAAAADAGAVAADADAGAVAADADASGHGGDVSGMETQ